MDSYTVLLCTEPPADGQLDALLEELRDADARADAVGAAFVSLVRPSSSGGSPVWRRLKDALSGDELERGGAAADVCGALDALADRVPTERDVSVSVVWLCGTRLPAPERSGLLSALLRWRLWLGALCQLRATGGGSQLSTWRRLLDADSTASLRPTLRLRLRLPAGALSTVINLQASCDTAAWEQLTAAAAAVHDGQSAALALLDGAEVVTEIGADSVPAAALTDCRLRLQRMGAAAAQQERCGWGDGRTALLVRLLAAPVGDGDRRRDAEDWRRMAVDGRPPDRRAPPPAARPLHFVITAGADGDGLMTLLAAEEVAALPHQSPELSLSELRALAAGVGWAAATELVCRLSGSAEEPAGWPERRGLAHWQEVQRRAAPDVGRPAADSLVLDADGILGALAGLSVPVGAWTAADSPRRLEAVPWPEVAEQHAPGVYYNTSAAAEERELRAARLRERCVAAETACTCSVWRSDAVSVSKAAPTPASRSSPRRRPASRTGPQPTSKQPHPTPADRPRQTEFRQRLAKAIQGALGEHGVGARDTMYRSCARKLATIVRAYLQDVKGAGETSARQMLQLARVHVKHVIQVQRELQGTS